MNTNPGFCFGIGSGVGFGIRSGVGVGVGSGVGSGTGITSSLEVKIRFAISKIFIILILVSLIVKPDPRKRTGDKILPDVKAVALNVKKVVQELLLVWIVI